MILNEGYVFLCDLNALYVTKVTPQGQIRTRRREMKQKCTHLDQIKVRTTDKHVCEECVKTGDTWVHLRMCLVCGKVGCCDSSKNRHATKHFHSTKHPVMRSVEPGESWIWCYIDEIQAGDMAA